MGALGFKEDPIVDDVDDDVRKAMAELRGEAIPDPVVNDNDEPDAGDIAGDVGGGDEPPKGTVRDAHGRFVKKSSDAAASEVGKADSGGTGTGGADKTAATPDDQSQSQPAANIAPPASWSIKAKAAWDQLPADVRSDIAKREGEMAQGLAALRDYKDLKPYADMAQQHGTTIAGALDHFVKMESLCRRDLGAGLAFIAQNSGLNQQQAAQLFSGLAQKFGGSVPATQPGAQPQNGQPNAQDNTLHELLAPLLNPLVSKIGALESNLTQRQQMDQQAQLRMQSQAIEQFAADPANRFLPELEGHMTQLFQSGMIPRTGNPAADLRAAYDMAARMHPEVSQALIEQRLQAEAETKRKEEQERAAKAKAASRSMSGSRVPGTVVKPPPSQQQNDSGFVQRDSDDVTADVMEAIRQLSMA